MNKKNTKKQYVKCIKDSNHILYDQIYQLTGLGVEEIEKARTNLGIPIYQGYDVRIINDDLFIGDIRYKLEDIKFIYDYAGIQEEIKQRLLDHGCYYERKTHISSWFNVERIEPRRAIYVDAIRLSNGFNNLYLKSAIKSDLSIIFTLQGMIPEQRALQKYVDKIGDAHLYGYHSHANMLCNSAEGLVAEILWKFTNKLIEPFNFKISHRISDRLYQLKRMVGNYNSMARTSADALFNTTYQFYEEEMWKLLEEKNINYLGVGGFSHFSYYSDLSWMGLPLDLCDSLKKAGHTKLVDAILAEEITRDEVDRLRGFKGENLYIVSRFGCDILYEKKEELFESSCYHRGKHYSSFRDACREEIDEFDLLLSNIGDRLEEEHLLIRGSDLGNNFAVKLWRLMLEWEYLPAKVRDDLGECTFQICQEEIQKLDFQPLVWMRSKHIDQRVNHEIANFEKLAFLFTDREDKHLLKHGKKIGQLSPITKEYSETLLELPVSWINLE
ncbi:MAG: hypothetical protein HZR80_04530 [Candidatus Heimdallarchaeota archaeon]